MGDIQTIDAKLGTHQYSTAANGAVNVTTDSTEIRPSTPSRLYAIFINDSDTVIYLALGITAYLHVGIRLNANGGTYEMNWTNLYTGAINAIHGGTGNKVVVFIEGT